MWVSKSPLSLENWDGRQVLAERALRLLFGAREGWCVHERPSVARKARQRVGAGTATLSRVSSNGGVVWE